jgi:electron-transferring-flavoprotein dehydrogenase
LIVSQISPFFTLFFSEIGSHILSGNVLDPKALQELFPDESNKDAWRDDFQNTQASFATPVTVDHFKVLLNEKKSVTIPHLLLPPQLDNHGNYIISLSQLTRWLATKAEELGVEIYPGFAASEVLMKQGTVYGIATRDVGLDKHGEPKSTFARGMELHARQVVLAEGARGSCSEYVMDYFRLRNGRQIQTYGLGLKEVWQVPKEQFQQGLVQHTLGYPLQTTLMDKTFGGSFLYMQEPDLVLIGLVVGLDYDNPYLNPYQEFQRWKTHPEISQHLKGGTCISYGARVLNEGGFHSIPKLTFPGGLLIGCAAGFLNAVKIKGTHTAIKSGMVAAESIFEGLTDGSEAPVAETGELPREPALEMVSYSKRMEESWVYKELYQVRNCHEAFAKWGTTGGLIYTGMAAFITKGREPWTLQHTKRDCDKTGEAKQFQPIQYSAPDNILTFDLLTNLQRSGTYHADDQPSHLRIKPELGDVPESISMQTYAAPEQRFCPAGVYEYVDDKDAKGGKKLVINAQNCIHCKCCSIKMPKEYIDWTVPEGGGGPQYQIM